MEHYYLTKDRITGYKTWLVREERAQATQEKIQSDRRKFLLLVAGTSRHQRNRNRVEKCTAAAKSKRL